MEINVRKDRRRGHPAIYCISWQDQDGLTKAAQVTGLDLSDSGIGFRSALAISTGTNVFIQGPEGRPHGYGVVRHCTGLDTGYQIGLEFTAETRKTISPSSAGEADYYELLQISSKAEPATIHRVHRFLAARYHPDNPKTGDPEKFLLLQKAFETLSDPERRAEYDEIGQREGEQPVPLSASIDFMDGIQGEVNRRLALLSLLYLKRRTNAETAEVSLAEVEQRMGFPRDYLDFTVWYLKNKKLITKGDNSDLALTADGVDYVESNGLRIPLLHKLLNSGADAATSREPGAERADAGSSEQVLISSPEREVNGEGR